MNNGGNFFALLYFIYALIKNNKIKNNKMTKGNEFYGGF